MKFNIPDSHLPRLVIIGAGFAGFTLATKLKGKKFQIVLIDKNNYHQFQPLYYQVAMGGLEPSSICFPLRRNFQKDPEFFVRVAEVSRIIPEEKKLESNIGIMRYDILVLAIGAKTNYFNNAVFERFSIPLKSVSEALFLRNRILSDLETAVMTTDKTDQLQLLDIIIVGGGPTGVELAGALAEMKQHILPKDYPDLDANKMDIHLIQGDKRLLASMSEKASAKAEKNLSDIGVQLHLNARVEDMGEDYVQLHGGEKIMANKIIWAAGVRGADIDGIPKSSYASGGRIEVDEFLQIKGLKDVFVIGDLAFLPTDKYPHGHPQVAPVALQMAALLTKNLQAHTKGNVVKPFTYFDKGSMATIGRHKAVLDYKALFLSGVLAWLAWLFVHIYYLIGARNKIVVLLNWFWSYIFYDQALRLMIKPYENKPIK